MNSTYTKTLTLKSDISDVNHKINTVKDEMKDVTSNMNIDFTSSIKKVANSFKEGLFPKSELSKQIDYVNDKLNKLYKQRNISISTSDNINSKLKDKTSKLSASDKLVYDNLIKQQELQTKRNQLANDFDNDNTDEINKLNADLKEINKSLKSSVFSDKIKEIQKLLSQQVAQTKKQESTVNNIAKLEKQRNTLNDKNSLSSKFSNAANSFGTKLKSSLANVVSNLVSKMYESLKTLIGSALTELNEMASYNLGSSYQINSNARNQAMQYGLSNEQNYAFSKVKSEMGISSDEDMYYMNDTQREKFAERMGYYTSEYNKLNDEDFFNKYEEFQLEIKEFKNEIVMTVVEWFVQNKDTVTNVLNMTLSFMKTVLNTLGKITEYFAGTTERSTETRANATADIISTYAANSTNNVNMKVDNTYNIQGAEDSSRLQNDLQAIIGNIYQKVINTMK